MRRRRSVEDPLGDGGVLGVAVGVEHLDRQDPDGLVVAGHLDAVVGVGGDDAGDVGAVPVVVDPALAARDVVVDAGRDQAGQVGGVRLDAGVEDRDEDGVACAQPGGRLLRGQPVQRPLVGPPGVVPRGRRDLDGRDLGVHLDRQDLGVGLRLRDRVDRCVAVRHLGDSDLRASIFLGHRHDADGLASRCVLGDGRWRRLERLGAQLAPVGCEIYGRMGGLRSRALLDRGDSRCREGEDGEARDQAWKGPPWLAPYARGAHAGLGMKWSRDPPDGAKVREE